MSNKKTLEQMSTTEAKRAGITSLADRPNDKSRYGDGGLSAEMLKARFDALPNLVREKFNKIAEVLAGTDAAKYITLGGEDNALGETLFDFLALFGPRGDGITDKNISDLIETLYQKEDSTVNVSTPIKDIVHDIERRIVKANAGRVTDARFDVASNLLIISFAGADDLRVDLSAISVGEGVSGEIERLKDTDADHERRIANIEEHISDDYFVTDNNVAYKKTVPARACLSAKLMSLGGMTYRDEETNTLRDSKVTEIKSYGANCLKSVNPATNTTVENGVVTQVTADSRTEFNYKVVGCKDATYVKNVATPDGTPKLGTVAMSFTKTSDFDTLRFGVNGSQRDTLVACDVSHLTDGKTYTLSFNMTNVTQGSISWCDVMLNEGATALPYEPYREPISYPIPTEIQVGKGINGYVDTIGFEAKKRTQRVNTVDLGSLVWDSSAASRFVAALPIAGKPTGSYDVAVGAICSNYSNLTQNTLYKGVDGISIQALTATNVYVFDSNYTDIATFKNAMAGVMLTYALAEPIETDISEALESFDNIIEVEGGGSLEFVNEYKNPVPSAVKYLLKEESAV